MTTDQSFTSRQVLFLYLAFLVLCAVATKVGWINPDGTGYCSYNASLYFDGDLNFWNQYVLSGMITHDSIHGASLTANGYVFTYWAIGAPMLWMPFWLIGSALTYLTGFFGQSYPLNGFSIYYNLGVRFATSLMGLCALIMNLLWIREYTGMRTARLGILLAALGTPYYWYLFHFADASHVPASFLISLFLIVWEVYRRGQRAIAYTFLLGLLGGFVSIIKPNHVFIFLFPLAVWISEFKTASSRVLMSQALWVALGAIFAFSLQLWVWQILFGNPLGPILEKGVQHYYKFFKGHFPLLDLLFSSYHGLFFFAPVLLFSFWGLIRLTRVDRVIAIPALLILISQILVMANERYFWEGASFGLRRVVDWTPLFALGIAYALKDAFKGLWRFVPLLAGGWTILLTLAYQRRPAALLNEYQPPSIILSWIGQTLSQLPEAARSMVSLPAPGSVLLPAFLAFAPIGYLLVAGIVKLATTCLAGTNAQAVPAKRPLRILTAILLLSFLFTYGLVGRAAFRSESSKLKYADEFKWLAQHQDSIAASEEVSFLLNEGKYLALSRNWNAAVPSFLEALQLSPHPLQTTEQIAQFAKQHLPPEAARNFCDSIANRQNSAPQKALTGVK